MRRLRSDDDLTVLETLFYIICIGALVTLFVLIYFRLRDLQGAQQLATTVLIETGICKITAGSSPDVARASYTLYRRGTKEYFAVFTNSGSPNITASSSPQVFTPGCYKSVNYSQIMLFQIYDCTLDPTGNTYQVATINTFASYATPAVPLLPGESDLFTFYPPVSQKTLGTENFGVVGLPCFQPNTVGLNSQILFSTTGTDGLFVRGAFALSSAITSFTWVGPMTVALN